MMTLEMKMRDRERIAAEKAKQKNKEQTAMKMIKKGMDNALIHELTELPFPRIEELRCGLTDGTA